MSQRMLANGYVIGPEKELLPDYKISPFSREDMLNNRNLPDSRLIDEYLQARFGERLVQYTRNGRRAINLALQTLHLSSEDIVTIFTTSGNLYISSCVTNEIRKFCRWSRKIEKNTKLILVNHEFGYPYERMKELREYGLPILEDCAHSFFSIDEGSLIGNAGDYSVYSLPKIFPMQIGGMLLQKKERDGQSPKVDNLLTKDEYLYIKSVSSHYIKDKDEICRSRRVNYEMLKELLRPLGITERLELKKGIVPGVFLFRSTLSLDALSELKKYMYKHGIECSVFYGEGSFYIPIHQNLREDDLVYFREVIGSFIDQESSR